ncbi:MAG: hypothetical protein JW878_09575 [Methanomicrobia archaeon]|nr:hypothetical protein [Methanomicrobia archaeon]
MSTVTAATKGKESKLVPLAVIIAALTGLLISIIAARASLPANLYYVAVISLLVTIFALLIYGFLAHQIYDFIKKRREIMKCNALARKYFGEFKHFTEIFGEFVNQSRSDNIPYALKDLFGNPAFRGVSYLRTDDFYNLFNCYKERLKRFDRTKEDFSLLVNEFDSILDIYNKHCIVEPVREIRAIGREKVDEQTKENYKKQKVTYERFIGNYVDFGKKRNGEFGERIFREYFEMPEEL